MGASKRDSVSDLDQMVSESLCSGKMRVTDKYICSESRVTDISQVETAFKYQRKTQTWEAIYGNECNDFKAGLERQANVLRNDPNKKGYARLVEIRVALLDLSKQVEMIAGVAMAMVEKEGHCETVSKAPSQWFSGTNGESEINQFCAIMECALDMLAYELEREMENNKKILGYLEQLIEDMKFYYQFKSSCSDSLFITYLSRLSAKIINERIQFASGRLPLLTNIGLDSLVLVLVLGVGRVVLVRAIALVVSVALVLVVLRAGSDLWAHIVGAGGPVAGDNAGVGRNSVIAVVVVLALVLVLVVVAVLVVVLVSASVAPSAALDSCGGYLALLVCVPLAVGVGPAVLVVLVVGVPLALGIGPAVLVSVVVGVPLSVGISPAIPVVVVGVPLALGVSPAILVLLGVRGHLALLICVPLAVGVSPAILVVLVPLAVGIRPTILVVGVPLSVRVSPAILVLVVVRVPLAIGVGPAVLVVLVVGSDITLLVCVPLSICIGPTILVVLVVRVPLAVGVSPAILVLVVVGVPLAIGISPAILVVLVFGVPLSIGIGPAVLTVLVVWVPLTICVGPTILVLLVVGPVTAAKARNQGGTVVLHGTRVEWLSYSGWAGPLTVLVLLVLLVVLAVLVVVAPLAVPINIAVLVGLAILVVAVAIVVRNELAVLPVTFAVLATGVPLTGLVVGINWEGEGSQRGDRQEEKAINHGVAHLEKDGDSRI
ncbi:unnamed protein product [Penicillium salamii]|nr:unnamed protein product [Penicillium salamii]